MTVTELHTGLRVVDRHISNGKLLVASPHAVLASMEYEVYSHETLSDTLPCTWRSDQRTAHHATATVLHPETLVDGIARGAHLELDIVQRCSLRDLPVDTGRA